MLTPAIYWVPELQSGRFAIMPRPRGDDWLSEEIGGLALLGLNHVVSLLEAHEVRELGLLDEAKSCEAHGVRFTSFPVPDRGVPASFHDASQLIHAVASEVSRGQSVAIHCRAGIGRSALIAGCVLTRLGVAETDAFPRLSRARGVKVPDTQVQIEWLASFVQRTNSVQTR